MKESFQMMQSVTTSRGRTYFVFQFYCSGLSNSEIENIQLDQHVSDATIIEQNNIFCYASFILN